MQASEHPAKPVPPTQPAPDKRIQRPAAAKPKSASAAPAPQPIKKAVAAAPVAREGSAVKPKTPPAPAAALKEKKPKLVRDSFAIPKAEYSVLEALKQRAANHAHPIKKSELLRAGIKALASMPDTAFLASLQAVPAIKTGRPKQAAEAGAAPALAKPR